MPFYAYSRPPDKIQCTPDQRWAACCQGMGSPPGKAPQERPLIKPLCAYTIRMTSPYRWWCHLCDDIIILWNKNWQCETLDQFSKSNLVLCRTLLPRSIFDANILSFWSRKWTCKFLYWADMGRTKGCRWFIYFVWAHPFLWFLQCMVEKQKLRSMQ